MNKFESYSDAFLVFGACENEVYQKVFKNGVGIAIQDLLVDNPEEIYILNL